MLAAEVIDHIRADREAGRTLREIATALNDRRVPSAHGGADTGWAFHGEFDHQLTEQWAGVDVSAEMGPGANPVRYFNC